MADPGGPPLPQLWILTSGRRFYFVVLGRLECSACACFVPRLVATACRRSVSPATRLLVGDAGMQSATASTKPVSLPDIALGPRPPDYRREYTSMTCSHRTANQTFAPRRKPRMTGNAGGFAVLHSEDCPCPHRLPFAALKA